MLLVAQAEEEKPGAPAGDPKRGGLELLCAKPLNRVGVYNMLIIYLKNVTFSCYFRAIAQYLRKFRR